MKLWYQENIEGWTEEELTAILETFLKSLEPEQEGNWMESWYKTELEKFLASCEADCPANLTEQEQQARQKILTELFVEVNRDVVWEQDIK